MEKINANLALHCFGFGADHNTDMLNDLALQCGGGDYLYIENVDSIATAFAQALGGLLSVVAQNISVIMESKYVVKYPDFKRNGNKLELGDLYAEEHRDLLFSFKLEPEISDMGSVRLNYFNLVNNTWVDKEVSISIRRSDSLS